MKKAFVTVFISSVMIAVSSGSLYAQGTASKVHLRAVETKKNIADDVVTSPNALQVSDQEIREFAIKLAHDFYTVDYHDTEKLMREIKPYAHPDQSWKLRGILTDRIEMIEKAQLRMKLKKLAKSEVAVSEEVNEKGFIVVHVKVPIVVSAASDVSGDIVEQNMRFAVQLVKTPRVPSNPDGLAIWTIGAESEEIDKK